MADEDDLPDDWPDVTAAECGCSLALLAARTAAIAAAVWWLGR